ncbi:MAG: hypothetical protein JEZ06_17525 [Anaerolineaceae bacterium]|nr:hypothetical protein [Anaerolineaceae bacterium]
MKKKFVLVVFSLLIIGSLLLAACGPAAEAPAEEAAPAEEEAAPAEEEAAPAEEEAAPAEEEAAPAEEEMSEEPIQIVFAEPGSYSALDPFTNAWHATPSYAVFATLVTLTPDLTEYVGYLVDGWVVAEDNMSLTFTLKEGVTFSDGTPVNSEAIKYNIDKQLDPELASPAGGDLRDNVASCDVVDDLNFTLNLQQPYAPILYVLSGLEIVSPTAYEELGPDAYSQQLIAAGPWTVTEIIPDVSITYAANPDFAWAPSYAENQGALNYDSLLIRYIGDEAVTYAALETGEIDIASIPPQFLPDAQANENIEIVEAVETTLSYLGINNEFPPFDNINVRKALAYGVNRDEIIQVGYEGAAIATYAPLAVGTIGYNKEMEDYSMETSDDQAMSIELLEGEGYVLNADGVYEKDGVALEFSFMVWPDPARQRVAETIQAQLAEIGVKTNIEVVESTVIKEATINGTHELMYWLYGYLDPMIMTYTFDSTRIGASNRNRVNDPVMDELLAAMDQELDPVARLDKVKDAQKQLIDNRYHIPLLTQVVYVGYRSDKIDPSFDVLGGILWFDTKPLN